MVVRSASEDYSGPTAFVVQALIASEKKRFTSTAECMVAIIEKTSCFDDDRWTLVEVQDVRTACLFPLLSPQTDVIRELRLKNSSAHDSKS